MEIPLEHTNYADLPVTAGPFAGDDVTVYELQVVDADSPNCVDFALFGPVDCIINCQLSNLAAEPVICTSDSTYSLQLNFDYEDVGGVGFDVFAQGQFIGFFDYAELPLEIEDFPMLGSDIVQLTICDNDNPNCCASIIYEALDCDVGCVIYEVTAEPFGCDLGTYLVELDLEYQNPGTLGFQVFGDGNNYGNFSYDDLPITLGVFEGDGVTSYEFIVVDLTNPDCVNFTNIDPVDCINDCFISDGEAIQHDCVDDMFMVTLEFDYTNIGTNGFFVQGDGTNFGIFDYEDLPITIGPLAGDGSTHYEFEVVDMENQNCGHLIELGVVDCSVSSTENPLEVAVNMRYDFVGEEVIILLEENLQEDAILEIYDAAGALQYQGQMTTGQLEARIAVPHFASGWYVCRMRNSEGQVHHSFVKAK